jgi:hypothetical protein
MTAVPRHILVITALLAGIVFFVLDKDSTPVAVAQTSAQVSAPMQYESPVPVQESTGTYEYLEITQGCNYDFTGRCIYAYSGPGVQYDQVYELREGMLLKVKREVMRNGVVWYQVYFDEWLRHPERVEGDWYIPANAGRIVRADGEEDLKGKATTSKKIIVDLSEHMIYAYDGDTLFMTTKVATGEELSPTPTGTFTIFKKTPTRYMQGPLPGINDNPFDLPGVPWNMYFTSGGAVIHGSYWHDRYGTEQSSGCVNLPPEVAKILYDWAPLGTTVMIRN